MDKRVMLNRQGFISDVLDLYDYIDELERENERLTRERNLRPTTKPKGLNYVDMVMLERGKKEIFNEVYRNWCKVKCTYNEDTGKYDFTPFNEWIKHKLDMDDMPRTLSFDDFVAYFKQELQERYAEEKKEAIKQAKENK